MVTAWTTLKARVWQLTSRKLHANLMIDRVAWDLQAAVAFFLVGREDGPRAAGIWALGLFLARFPTSFFHSNYLHPYWMGAREGGKRAPTSEAVTFFLFYVGCGLVGAGFSWWAISLAFFYSAQALWHDCLVALEETRSGGQALGRTSGLSFGVFLALILCLPSGEVPGLVRVGIALALSRLVADLYLAVRVKVRWDSFRPVLPAYWGGMARFVAYSNESLLIQGFFLWVALRQGAGALGNIALVLSLFRPLEVMVQGDARYLLGRWSALPLKPLSWAQAKGQIQSRMKWLVFASVAVALFGAPLAEVFYRISFRTNLFLFASSYFLSVAAVTYLRNLSLAFGKLPPMTWLVLIGGGANVFVCELAGGSVERAFMGQTLVLIFFAALLWATARKAPLASLGDWNLSGPTGSTAAPPTA